MNNKCPQNTEFVLPVLHNTVNLNNTETVKKRLFKVNSMVRIISSCPTIKQKSLIL